MKRINDSDIGMDEYQFVSISTASYPDLGDNIVYPALGLAGEAGEVAEKVKKLWRNQNKKSGKDLDILQKEDLIKELGDCLWYIAAMANELRVDLSYIARVNIEKLRDRKERDVIKGEGDNR